MGEMIFADQRAFENWVLNETCGFTDDDTDIAHDAWHAALAHARGKQELVAWLPMDRAPKDSTMVRLLVEPDDTDHTSFEDSDGPYVTIGFNQLEHALIDAWEFAGWDWQQDVFISGAGAPIGWLPLSAPPAESEEVARLRADLEAAQADRDALLTALSFKAGPLGANREMILAEAAGRLSEMVKAREKLRDYEDAAVMWWCLCAEGGPPVTPLLLTVWNQRKEAKKEVTRLLNALAEIRELNMSGADAQRAAQTEYERRILSAIEESA